MQHKKYGAGLVFDMAPNARAGTGATRVAVYWLDPRAGPPWRGPRVRARELSHDWDLQAECPDTWTHASDGEWEA